MQVLIILGLLSLFFGVLLLVSPKRIKDMSDKVDKVIINMDAKIMGMRVGLGICLVSISVVCFFLVYYFMRK